jgi:hypothetical protein
MRLVYLILFLRRINEKYNGWYLTTFDNAVGLLYIMMMILIASHFNQG